MIKEGFLALCEYAAAGLYEEPDRNLFYRKSLAIRRFYENCELAEYSGEALYPSGVISQKMKVVPSYMHGITADYSALSQRSPELTKVLFDEFFIYKSSVPTEHTVAGNMWNHSMPNYERILSEGLLSYVPRIEKISDPDMREGLVHLISGIESYINRCTDYLKSVGAEQRLINALEKVPLHPADNLYEAIVSWNFIMYLDNCDNLGCLARGLIPYYRGEDAISLLSNLYDNLDKNNGYSMSLDSECPELTVQCLKACHGKRRPMIELFVDEKTPREVWLAAFDAIRAGGQPAFYNPDALLGGLKKRFPSILDGDIYHFCGGGCTESMITGKSCVGSLDAGINLLLILEEAMNERLSLSESFDDFYRYYLSSVKSVVEKVKAEINNSRLNRSKYNPAPMRTLLIDDCIDKATEYFSGGARYNWSIINFAGLINVIDSLVNIKNLVFEEKKYSGEELLTLLQKGDEAFLCELIRQKESYGKDNGKVNLFAKKLSKEIFETTKDGELVFGEGFLSATIQFQSYAEAGKRIGATPDGRAKGAPLCDSLGAIFGKDTNGPTALLNSVASLDLSSALGTPVLSFNLQNGFNDEVVKALVLGYMKKGGIQIQITHASREQLLDAYAHPEKHGNLIVRVGGYSEYFNRLTDDLKKVIINRTIQSDL